MALSASLAALAPQVVEAVKEIKALTPRVAYTSGGARMEIEAIKPEGNLALMEWRRIKTKS